MPLSYCNASLLITFYTTTHLDALEKEEGEIQLNMHEAYFEENVKSFYAKLKKGLAEELRVFGAQSPIDPHYYQPHAYCIFGRFDLAVLTVIENHEINIKSRHANSVPTRFGHKLLAGVAPRMDARFELKEQAKKTFLNAEGRLPYIGICSLKLRNSLLIGSGSNYMACILEYIKRLSAKFQVNDGQAAQLEVIISETFSWNEITLVIFSESFQYMGEFILELRESYFSQMEEVLTSNRDNSHHSYLEAIKKNSLFSFWQGKEDTKMEIGNAPLFETSSTQFGFDICMFSSEEKAIRLKEGLEDLKLFTKFIARPGQLKNALKKAQIDPQDSVNIAFGNADFFIPNLSDMGKRNWSLEEMDTKLRNSEFRKFIADSYTVPSVDLPSDKILEGPDSPLTPYYRKRLVDYTYDEKTLNELEKKLDDIGVNKMLKERLFRNISNYKEGILHPVLYIYFIELRPYLDQIEEFINENYIDGKKNTIGFSDRLNGMVERFETAYLNREHQSYNLLEISDNSTKFSGGIQQLLTGIDAVYKILCLALGDKEDATFFDKSKSLVYLTGYSGVSSFSYSMKINPMHVFHPAIFVAIVTHEATNHFLEKIKDNEQFIKFKHLEGGKVAEIHNLLSTEDEELQKFWKENLKEPLFDVIDQKQREAILTEENVAFLRIRSEEIGINLFNYLLSDLITYYFAFNQDAKLFDYWHWHYFLQTPDNYTTKTEVSEENFRLFLLRMMLLHEITGSEHYCTKIFAPNENLQVHWDKDFSDTKKLVDICLKIDPLNKLFNNLHTIALAVVYNSCYNEETARQKISEIDTELKETKGGLQAMLKDKNSTLKIDLKLIREEIAKDAENIKRKLEAGQLIDYPTDLLLKDKIKHVQSLFLGYLEILTTSNNEGNTLRFHWINKTNEIPPVIEDYQVAWASYLFDSQGGMVGNSTETRANIFRYTSAFIKSLWDIGVKEKINLFKYYRLKEEENPTGVG